jgi:hypothetical protein
VILESATSRKLNMHLIGCSGRINASDWLIVAVVKSKYEPLYHSITY